jgi:CDP-glycerol glycerophosphotransferase (TagB/SpsB family)
LVPGILASGADREGELVASRAKQIYWAVLRAWKAGAPGELVERWESQTGDRQLPDDYFETMVYFADGVVNMYQLRQWFAPLRALDQQSPVALVCRSAAAALALLEESPVPVIYAPRMENIEDLVNRQRFKMALYVNQNTRNFQMMRINSMLHVFISHGESDKSYMVSGQMKCYDYAFIAGDAAASRLSKALLGYDIEARTKRIGRPQLDFVPEGGPPLPDDGRTVVFYAPTWEGDRPSMSYGSLTSHGVAMVKALLASPQHRLIFRPHPRTGVVSSEHEQARSAIEAMIAQANLADPSARHFSDTTASFDWQFHAADACITDVSAVAIDWLTTGKPMIVTRPASSTAVLPTEGFLADTRTFGHKRATDVVAELQSVAQDAEQISRQQAWTHWYFGDTTPGVPSAAWLQACREVREQRDRWLAALSDGIERHPEAAAEIRRATNDLEEIEFES